MTVDGVGWGHSCVNHRRRAAHIDVERGAALQGGSEALPSIRRRDGPEPAHVARTRDGCGAVPFVQARNRKSAAPQPRAREDRLKRGHATGLCRCCECEADSVGQKVFVLLHESLEEAYEGIRREADLCESPG